MALYILTIKRPIDGKIQEWYFDNHMDNVKACQAAKAAGIFVAARSDMWTEAFEFTDWLADEQHQLGLLLAEQTGREHG